ncbi:hypothetical protein [Crocosphaera sp. XPORK-15E]|uniref:hypothetical protein n=1 Tax=Crocosphaera sp. XPORK-15E TaxID=3110247 RepID=UPI002B1F0A9B|nr:hypothetical protein [Crocosphaera sp. XPORK-15E]MEA5536537.1 hypothetical protein [Crocosphaera sp. XPORK-15E]
MLEIFLIAQCSLTLPNGSIQTFEFCGNTPKPNSAPSQPSYKPAPSSEYYELTQSSDESSNVPVSYQYLTKENYSEWQALAKNFDPISHNSSATLNEAQSLFGSGKVIQRKGTVMQKIKWEELNRSVEAWFKFENNNWILMNWNGKGF